MRQSISVLIVLTLFTGCSDDDSSSNNNNQNITQMLCGDGVLEEGEQCDDGEENSDLEPDACRTNCRTARCGDRVVDADEQCDGPDLAGATCQSRGHTSGILACTGSCTFDESQCTDCGDGLAEGDEVCDGSDLAGETCQSQAGRTSGALVCDPDCGGFDTSGCYTCGDGAREAGELCDGDDLAHVTCEDLGHDGGQLACSAGCTHDETSCFDCGDGRCDRALGEDLDGCGADCGWVQLSATYLMTCGLRGDGTVWCWGQARWGSLGDGGVTQPLATAPNRVEGIQDAVQISAGYAYACARLASGALRCWGRNERGQLGNGTTLDATMPVAVHSIQNAQDISVGFRHACALDTGQVYCWGWNKYGQLGVGDTLDASTPQQVALSGLPTQVSAGSYHSCARLDSGVAYCWGGNEYGQLGVGSLSERVETPSPVEQTELTHVSQIVAAHTQTYAVDADHRAWSWGNDYYETRGDGPGGVTRLPFPARVEDYGGSLRFAQIDGSSVYLRQVCGTSITGTVHCWGYGYEGALGIGTTDTRTWPAHVSSLSGITGGVTSGQAHSCAWVDEGPAWCWGRNYSGQLGLGYLAVEPSPVVMLSVTAQGWLAPGYSRNCACETTGCLCWGYNSNSQLGDRGTLEQHHPTHLTVDPAAFDSLDERGIWQSCGLAGGVVRCWGSGHPEGVDVPGLTSPVQVSTGYDHTCAVDDVGASNAVLCWGSNGYGQLGRDGDASDTPTLVAGLVNPQAVAAGHFHTCALELDGSVWCWGMGSYGELGDEISGLTTYQPVQVTTVDDGLPRSGDPLQNAVAIAATGNFSCALDNLNTVWCWGENERGQLADGTQVNRFYAAPVPGLTAVDEISAGSHHVCALKLDGTLWCWGSNQHGAIGDGTFQDRFTPTQVPGLTGVKQVVCGSDTTCAINDDGTSYTVWCWGSNAYGQIGNGQSGQHTLPLPVVNP